MNRIRLGRTSKQSIRDGYQQEYEEAWQHHNASMPVPTPGHSPVGALLAGRQAWQLSGGYTTGQYDLGCRP